MLRDTAEDSGEPEILIEPLKGEPHPVSRTPSLHTSIQGMPCCVCILMAALVDVTETCCIITNLLKA